MAKGGGILAPDLEGVNKQELCGKDLWDITITVSISNFGANIKKLIGKNPNSCFLIYTFLLCETILVRLGFSPAEILYLSLSVVSFQ